MADKKDKPKDRTTFTKAGRNSKSGGRNQRAARKADLRQSMSTMPLPDAIHKDRLTEQQQEQADFRLAQAALANELLKSSHIAPLAETMATLIIGAFIEVTFDRNVTTRTKAAIDQARGLLSSTELKRTADIRAGIGAAKWALAQAFKRLKELPPAEEADAIIAQELINA